MSFKGKVIARQPVHMHVTPWPGSRVLPRRLEAGDIVDLENVEDGWLAVYDPKSGQMGWVDKDCIQEIVGEPPDLDPAAFDAEVVDFCHKAVAIVFGLFAFATLAFLALFGIIR